MIVYPAIDLRGGRCVRLLRGDYAAETVYADDPVSVARGFEAGGARWIHVVDLDAARTAVPANLEAVAAVCGAVACPVQVGGGVRDRDAAETLLGAGAARVVVGSAAVERPELVDELAAAHPGRVAVGLDARGGDVAIHGWTDATGHDLVTLARRFDRPGVGALVVTQIERDGTLAGPDLEQLAGVLAAVDAPVIASGGVGGVADLGALAALEVPGADGATRRLSGAIVGRALYEGRLTLEEAIAACSAPA